MSAIASAAPLGRIERGERVSWSRLAWVAPLTLGAAVAACYIVKSLVLLIDPSLSRMGQLGPAMPTLAIEGTLAAIVVFALFGLFVPRPIFWYRIVAVVALVLSWAPDIGLGIGGTAMQMSMRFVGPLTSIGEVLGLTGGGGGGPRPAGPPPGAGAGGPPGGFAGASIEQVAVLMLLHATVALVCVGLLTTLARARTVRN